MLYGTNVNWTSIVQYIEILVRKSSDIVYYAGYDSDHRILHMSLRNLKSNIEMSYKLESRKWECVDELTGFSSSSMKESLAYIRQVLNVLNLDVIPCGYPITELSYNNKRTLGDFPSIAFVVRERNGLPYLPWGKTGILLSNENHGIGMDY